jgi:hypothetical protein
MEPWKPDGYRARVSGAVHQGRELEGTLVREGNAGAPDGNEEMWFGLKGSLTPKGFGGGFGVWFGAVPGGW